MNADRAVELLGILGAGFGLRSAARELLDVVPLAGWVVKGGVAYSGTRALGRAAVEYFERGAVADVTHLRALAERVPQPENAGEPGRRHPVVYHPGHGPSVARRPN